MNKSVNYPMLTDTFFNDQRSAFEAAHRIRSNSKEADILVKVDQSPYGGWRIRVIPMDIALDMAENVPGILSGK